MNSTRTRVNTVSVSRTLSAYQNQFSWSSCWLLAVVASTQKVTLRHYAYRLRDNLMDAIFRFLDLSTADYYMVCAAHDLAYFGFLHSTELTVPNWASFSLAIHQGVADIAIDSDVSPSCLRVRIKALKTDPLLASFPSFLPSFLLSLLLSFLFPSSWVRHWVIYYWIGFFKLCTKLKGTPRKNYKWTCETCNT